MKASFFSVVALATSAFAAPVVQDAVNNIIPGLSTSDLTPEVNLPIKRYGPVPENDPKGTPAGASDGVAKDTYQSTPQKITGNQGLLDTLQYAKTSAGDITWSLKYIVDRFTDGKIPKDEAADETLPELKKLETLLTSVSGQLSGATGIDITATADVQAIVSLCVGLTSTVLGNLKVVVKALGTGHPDIKVIVKSICNIIGKLLVILAGLVSAIVPGLNESLQPIISKLGQGILSPFLGTVSDSFNGILSGLAV